MIRRLFSIVGNRQRLDGGAMFGHVPRAMWESWITPDERNRIELACRCLLVQDKQRNILFETGIGAFFEDKLRDRYGVIAKDHRLLARLADLGLEHKDIGVVVLSHLHFDHAGGLLTPYHKREPPALLFPNATYVVGRTNWERATDPHPRDEKSFIPVLNELLDKSGRMELVDTESFALGDEYKLRFSHGHTPGLMCTEITTNAGPLVYASDLVPGRAWVHRSVSMGYDRNAEQLTDEKTALLDDMVARQGRLFFCHDPSVAAARITRDDRGRYGSDDPERDIVSEEIPVEA